MTVFPEFMDKNDEVHFFEELKYWGIPVKAGIHTHIYNHKPSMP